MFSLTDSLRYWLYSEPTDMRKSFYTLSGLVTNRMHQDPLNGDAYIFMNKSRNRMKILRMESGGLTLYCKMLEVGKFYPPKVNNQGIIQWSDLIMMVEGVVKNETTKYKRLESLKEKKYCL